MKNILTLLLLASFAFSSVHELAFTLYDEDHCSVQEYVSEIQTPSHHGDICDIHFEFHQAFLLPETALLLNKVLPYDDNFIVYHDYFFQAQLQFLKPPIA